MKTLFNILGVLMFAGYLEAQPVVYFNFISHNEETSTWDGLPYYTTNRTRIVSLANDFNNKGITWNMQSDWRFLKNVIQKDTTFFGLTSGKNVLRWMHEDKGVEMDPHAHESIYIYPDVVKLMDSLGLPESKVMGGTIYNDSNGVNVWTNLINGQYGIIFPDRFWQPDYMMGGGTPNHVNDLNYYGFWNPADTAHYLTHNPYNHLKHLGVGCELKIRDTSTISVVVNFLRDVVNKVQTGYYPSNGFYLQEIFFEQGDLNDIAFYNKLVQVADSANAIVAEGHAQWKTFKQAYTIWENNFSTNVFQWECDQQDSTMSIAPVRHEEMRMYPNPTHGKLKIETGTVQLEKVEVFSLTGSLLRSETNPENSLEGGGYEIDLSDFPSGLYFINVTTRDQVYVRQLILSN